MYYMLIVIALSGNTVTTLQSPLTDISSIEGCMAAGNAAKTELLQVQDKVEIICMDVKK